MNNIYLFIFMALYLENEYPGLMYEAVKWKMARFSLKVHKIENFFASDFGICVISLIVMSKY
jgi:hypothetical protein